MEYCNFCGRSEKEVGPMYYGLKGCICKECADLLYDVLAEYKEFDVPAEDAMKTKQHIYKQCVKDTPLDLFIEEIELKYAPNFRIKLNTYLETQPVITRYNMLEK